ncbi:MAG: MBL fold metallo-hydrolase [Candidatus Aminicenantes bacterium]|nr:MBL fold metallo-hydrolase [Candidatus Aminicenantes bacterium]
MKNWETKNGYQITRVLAGRSNVFLISKGGRNILVDTSPAGLWKKLERNLRRLGVERLDALVLTHTHYDHAGNAARVQEKYKAPVIVQRFEASFLAGGEAIVPHGTNFLGRLLIDHLGKNLVPRLKCPPCRPDLQVDDTLSLADFGFNAHIVHTPGHSPGSQSVVVDDEIALVGDAMFGVVPWSVFPPFASDAGQLLESWGKLLATNCRLFLPSHGTANPRALVQKNFDRRKRLEPQKTIM